MGGGIPAVSIASSALVAARVFGLLKRMISRRGGFSREPANACESAFLTGTRSCSSCIAGGSSGGIAAFNAAWWTYSWAVCIPVTSRPGSVLVTV